MQLSSPLLLAALLTLPTLALAQGSLTPPAAPAPTMKTLDQIEPRIPLQAGAPGVTVNANGGFTIMAPGSYYLTGNLTVATGNGIWIESNNVTLDLNGFCVRSTSATMSGSGVVSGGLNATIRNGQIASNSTWSNGAFIRSGFQNGAGGSGRGILVEDVTVTGVCDYAISAQRIVRCHGSVCVMTGLEADTVIDSSATDCGNYGISAHILVNCTGRSGTSDGTGIYVWEAAINCIGTAAGSGSGLYGPGRAENCTGESASGAGLVCSDAIHCSGTSNSGIGLNATRSAANSYGATTSGTTALLVGDIAESCNGYAFGTGTGLQATVALNCRGASAGGTGVQATTVTNCYGRTNGTGVGIDAVTASGSYGESANNTGLRVDASADNCRGVATGTGYGLYSGGNALNCTGTTKTGTYGLFVVGTASVCRGNNDAASTTKFALHAGIAIGCTAQTGTIDAAQKFHGTP